MRESQRIPEQRLRLWLLWSLIFLRRVQIFREVLGYRCSHNVFGNTVEKLANTWILARLDFVFRADGAEGTLIEHRNAVRDEECARQFVGNNDDGHMEGVLEEQNQFVKFRSNDGVK